MHSNCGRTVERDPEGVWMMRDAGSERREHRRKARNVPEEDRRRDIIRAARKVFAEKGFHEAKIEDIAKHAGIAHGTVYRYYASKYALAAEIIGSRAAGYLERLRGKVAEESDPKKLFTKVARKYYGNLEQRLPLMRFRIAQAVSNPDFGRSYYKSPIHRLLVELDGVMRMYQKKKIIRAGDPFVYGHLFYGMCFGFLYCQELMLGKETTKLNVQKMIPTIVDVFLHGVSAARKQERVVTAEQGRRDFGLGRNPPRPGRQTRAKTHPREGPGE